jgi:pimeloyl-ACP methyl ester carboxylesterase
VILLLAGSHGNLQLSDDGRLGWGAGNQLVRTRSEYARAGFVTALPDVAEDLRRPGGGAVDGYRWSEAHARDLGALVRHLRTIAQPVYLVVGTSRAAMSVANAAVRTQGDALPDAIVITAGMLMERSPKQPNVQRNVRRLGRITVPALIVHHLRDECAYTPAADVEPFAKLLTGSPRVEIRMLEGGFTRGDPCEAQSYHGFLGIDAEVVRVVTGWLRQLAAKSERK